jgi:hypothetical protein
MLLIVLALVWVAILVPIVIRHFRESGGERSIEHFHAEHDVLSRHEYSVSPAHRLEMADRTAEANHESRERPRLTVVHADDTYRSLETRGSWGDWSQDYDYEDEPRVAQRPEPGNRYAAAYSSVPSEHDAVRYDTVRHQEPLRARASMKVRRTRIFLGLLAGALLFTVASFVVGSSVVQDLALLLWLGLVGFVAAALIAVSQGYLHESSLPVHLPSRQLATIAPLHPEGYEEVDEFYEAEAEDQWRRESSSRHAVG